MVGKRNVKKKLIVSGFIFVICFSFFSVLAMTRNAPVQYDVLIVRVGENEATTTTSGIVTETLTRLKLDAQERDIQVIDSKLAHNSILSESSSGTQHIAIEFTRKYLRTQIIESNLLSFEEDISKFRAEILIVIGHGSDIGLISEDNPERIIEWNDAVSATDIVQSQVTIFASCFSSNAVEFGEHIVGFNGIVDAKIAGYIVSLLILQTIPEASASLFGKTLESAVNRWNNIENGDLDCLPLSVKSDWAAVRMPVISMLTGIFLVGGYYLKWQSMGLLGALLAYSAGFALGYAFQFFLELLRVTVGAAFMTIDPNGGRLFNSVIGFLLGFVISYSTPFLLPSFVGSFLYFVAGTTAAIALSNTPDFWIRVAACAAAAIGMISLLDMIIQFI